MYAADNPLRFTDPTGEFIQLNYFSNIRGALHSLIVDVRAVSDTNGARTGCFRQVGLQSDSIENTIAMSSSVILLGIRNCDDRHFLAMAVYVVSLVVRFHL